MLWQDFVITATSIVFSAALIPQIYRGFKDKKGHIAYATSIPTFAGLYLMCYVYFTLDLFLSTVVCFITGTMWLTLFVQKLIYK